MTKRIRDTEASKQMQVAVILKDGEYVGKILTHYSLAGVVTNELYEEFKLVHSRKASGGNYDKYTASLRGANFYGHILVDHCDESLPRPDCGYFPRDFECPLGYHLANCLEHGYSDCYKRAGTDYLKDFGYNILNLI